MLAWTAIALESWRRYMAGDIRWKDREYDLRPTTETSPPTRAPVLDS